MENFGTEELKNLFIQYALKEGTSTLLSSVGLQDLLKNHFSKFLVSLLKTVLEIKYGTFKIIQGFVIFSKQIQFIDAMQYISYYQCPLETRAMVRKRV